MIMPTMDIRLANDKLIQQTGHFPLILFAVSSNGIKNNMDLKDHSLSVLYYDM